MLPSIPTTNQQSSKQIKNHGADRDKKDVSDISGAGRRNEASSQINYTATGASNEHHFMESPVPSVGKLPEKPMSG